MFRRTLLALPSLASILLVSGVARAQTVAASGMPYPDRILNAKTSQEVNLGSSTRPQNQTPLGISYADCVQDQTLRFSVLVSTFAGQALQVWASRTGDCTMDTSRGNPGPASCWIVNQGQTAINSATAATFTFDVRVQDLVAVQNAPPNPPTPYVHHGPEACTTQPSFSGETFNVYFVPITNGNMGTGTAYDYVVNVDMIGPPAPAVQNLQVGDTLFVVNWTPNVDTDTAGYDVFMDPIPGQEAAGPTTADGSGTQVDATTLECPDTGSTPPIDAGDDGSDAAIADASPVDSGCHPVNQGGSSGGSGGGTGSCSSAILSSSSSIVQDGSVPVQQFDDAGNPIDDGGATGVGGISTIPANYVLGGSGTGVSVSDKSTGTFTVRGLQDGTTYNVVVAAVDGYGNVGPSSQELCDYPAPVNDFWHDYRAAGGQAGGSFCALDAVGMPVGPSIAILGFGTAALTLARRRRRDKR